MGAAIRQTLKVAENGRLEIRSPELQSGTTAEVIVHVTRSRTPEERLAILNELRRGMSLTPDSAQAWMDQVRDERMKSTRPIK